MDLPAPNLSQAGCCGSPLMQLILQQCRSFLGRMHRQLPGCPPELWAALRHNLERQVSQLGGVEACAVIHTLLSPLKADGQLLQVGAVDGQQLPGLQVKAYPAAAGAGYTVGAGQQIRAWQIMTPDSCSRLPVHIATKATCLQDSTAGQDVSRDSAGWPGHRGMRGAHDDMLAEQ